MRIGLISDTHGQLRPAVFDRFQDVDHILHAGDIGTPDILVELEVLAPVTAVWGNTDGFAVRARVPETAEVVLAGRRIVVVHGHQFGSPTPAELRAAHPNADVVVYGHTHRPLLDRNGSPLVVNPGAAGPARFNLRPSVAILTLSDTGTDAEFFRLTDCPARCGAGATGNRRSADHGSDRTVPLDSRGAPGAIGHNARRVEARYHWVARGRWHSAFTGLARCFDESRRRTTARSPDPAPGEWVVA